MKTFNTEIINNIQQCYKCGNSSKTKDIYYQNVFGYRKANMMFFYSYDELNEYSKCTTDPTYFIENYCERLTYEGYTKLKLRYYQKRIINNCETERFNIVLSARQTGISTVICLLMLYEAMFRPNKNIVLMSNKLLCSVEMLDLIKQIYAKLPFFLKPGVVSFSTKHIFFDNGSRIYLFSKSSLACGFSINSLYLHDFAFISNADKVYHSFITCISAIKDAKLFISSTPNGYNMFYRLYIDALRGVNELYASRVDWWEVSGRGEEWKQQEIKNLGSEELFNREYGLLF